MRILLLTHEFYPFSGGVGRYCHDLASAAAKRGHAVTILAPDYGEAEPSKETSKSFAIERFAGGKFRPSNILHALFALVRALRKQRWDIVHAADWPFVVLCCLLRKVTGMNYVATTHGTDIPILKSGRLARTLFATDGYSKAQSVAANSSFTLQRLKSVYPDNAWNHAQVTYLGVSSFWMTPVSPAESDAVKQQRGIDIRSRCVISVGRIDERKGQHLVVKALTELPAEISRDLAYLIVGKPQDDGYFALLQTLAKDCPAKVHFLHGLDDTEVRALLAGSAIFCIPGAPVADGRVEGFGLAYLEAAAQGVPAIGPDMWAVPEVVRHEETGLLVSPADLSSVTAALRMLLSDEAKRSEMGEKARAWSRKFTWDNCAQLTYETPA